MGLRIRWTLIGTAACLTLAAVAVLPPRACDPLDMSPARVAMCAQRYRWPASHAAVAERARDRLRQALRRRHLADSLLQSATTQRLTASGITLYYETPLSADSARRWLSLAQRELAMIPGVARGRPVVLALLTDRRRYRQPGSAAETERLWWYHPRLDRFATGGAAGACFVVRDLARDGTADRALEQQRPALLDWCALVGRYGEPGSAVQSTLSVAFAFGWRDHSSMAEMVQSIGVTSSFRGDRYQLRACRSGEGSACLRFLGFGEVPSAPAYIRRDPARDLLAWLVATAEPAQFARFWRADGTLEDALHAGFQRPAGDILAAWSKARFEAAPARTEAEPRQLLAGAVWFSLAMVAAFVAMQRRQAR